MPKNKETVVAYKEAVEIFNSLPTLESENTPRRKDLVDGTQVMINRYQKLDASDIKTPTLDSLYVQIKSGRGSRLVFSLNENGLKRIIISTLLIKIGDSFVQQFDTPDIEFSLRGCTEIAEEDSPAFRVASRPLVNWLKRIVTDDHYSAPPVETVL